MLEKIRKWIKQMKYNWSKQSCYDSMERRGIAVFGMCSGVVGGDRNTGYLAYSCVDCPYFTFIGEDKIKEIKEKENEQD